MERQTEIFYQKPFTIVWPIHCKAMHLVPFIWLQYWPRYCSHARCNEGNECMNRESQYLLSITSWTLVRGWSVFRRSYCIHNKLLEDIHSQMKECVWWDYQMFLQPFSSHSAHCHLLPTCRNNLSMPGLVGGLQVHGCLMITLAIQPYWHLLQQT